MNKGVANTVIGCVAFMALVMGLTAHRILSPAVMTQQQMVELDLFVYPVPLRYPDFALTDTNNGKVTKETLKGHWTLMFFGFTSCPDVCPTTLANIKQFHDLLRAENPEAAANLQVIFVSVDPMRDTPEKIGAYVKYFGEDYIGATSDPNTLLNFARNFGVTFQYIASRNNDGTYDVDHNSQVALINPEADFHGFFNHGNESIEPTRMEPLNPENMLVTFESVLRGWKH